MNPYQCKHVQTGPRCHRNTNDGEEANHWSHHDDLKPQEPVCPCEFIAAWQHGTSNSFDSQLFESKCQTNIKANSDH